MLDGDTPPDVIIRDLLSTLAVDETLARGSDEDVPAERRGLLLADVSDQLVFPRQVHQVFDIRSCFRSSAVDARSVCAL